MRSLGRGKSAALNNLKEEASEKATGKVLSRLKADVRLPCWKGVMRLYYFRQSPKVGAHGKITVPLSPWTMKTATWLSVKGNLLSKIGQKDKKKSSYLHAEA